MREALASPLERYTLERSLGAGAFGRVAVAADRLEPGKRVAVEIYDYSHAAPAQRQRADREHRALRDAAHHPNIAHFYGAFCDPGAGQMWFAVELCECSLLQLARRQLAAGGAVSEEHIAFVLKAVVKGLMHLHERKVVHGDVRARNVQLGADGEVKLGGFSLARAVSDPLTAPPADVGSPAWMSPEVAVVAGGCAGDGAREGPGSRADVWSLGIAAIELADGRAPYEDMHPSRAIFQIVRNPPPGLVRPSCWSNTLNDFISECLEKNPEHRPFAMELAEHPFILAVPENDYHLTQELRKVAVDSGCAGCAGGGEEAPESVVERGAVRSAGAEPEPLHVEDLAALEPLTEEGLLRELQLKWGRGAPASYVGDYLLVLNACPGDVDDDDALHGKYACRSRSDNEPHVFGVADAAYQDALHHDEPQHLVLCGESGSGKSATARRALRHLTHLGAAPGDTAERVRRAESALRAATAAATPVSAHSTRCVLQASVTYGPSGKLSGAVFHLYQLEKWRVASTDMTQANFDLLYYFYDAMEADGKLETYGLEKGRKQRYLRAPDGGPQGAVGPRGARDTPHDNVESYRRFCRHLAALDCEPEETATLESVLAAVLALGNVRFKESKDGSAEIENPEAAGEVARLLQLERAKFSWALLNYCVVRRGTAVQRRHSADEARDARDALAAALYKRLLDSLVNRLNFKLSFGRAVFGDKYSISILDMFGFECFHRNRLEQLIVNTTNEQMQFLYNQRTFAWEMQEAAEEAVPAAALHFYDNKTAVDQLMGRPLGLFYILDEASRSGGGLEFIMSTVKNSCKGPYIKLSGSHEFSVAHYAGKISYDAREMADKNRDFLPPEMIETMRASGNVAVQALFRNKLTRTGNVTFDARPACERAAPLAADDAIAVTKADKEVENIKTRKCNTISRGHWSQLHRMRTAAATYRATSLELLRQLSVGPGSGGTHFVKCVRTDLAPRATTFQPDLVRHQLRALAILDTARARQDGFSCRVPFAEFIRRYKFLAFDFDENVEETQENCRLLLIRLKMEGWVLGKTKVFLKYYNEEFLARLYESQVKKIVKVQSMMRAFLARRRAVKSKSKEQHLKELKKQHSVNVTEDEAALLIQKAYRGYVVRKAYGPLVSKATGQIDEETASFLKRFALKWKSRSVFQVLLQYRAVRYQDLVHFSQQVHIYNQAAVSALTSSAASAAVPLERVEPRARERDFLGTPLPSVRKLPFRIDQLQYIDTSELCRPSAAHPGDTFASQYDSDQETWDGPVKRRSSGSGRAPLALSDGVTGAAASENALIHVPFCRDPAQTIPKLPEEAPSGTARPHRAPARPPVYKKKQAAAPAGANYQPPTPWSARDQRRALEGGVPGVPGGGRGARGPPAPAADLQDSIRELQQLARSAGCDVDSGDEAPFNFQAMLKKTPKNRASMKRSGDNERSAPAKVEMTPEIVAPPPPKNRAPSPPPPKNHAPAPPPPKSPAPAPPPPKSPAPATPRARFTPITSPDIFELADRNGCDESVDKSNKTEYERVELAPGIAVEGAVVDL